MVSEPAYAALIPQPPANGLAPELVKGKQMPVGAYRVGVAIARTWL